MSIYIIKLDPDISSRTIKVGLTTKTSKSKKPVHKYLYERYRTTYGKRLTAYIWECNSFRDMEREIFEEFSKYKIEGSEVFKGTWRYDAFKHIFAYCCKHISNDYMKYSEGELEALNNGWHCCIQ